MSYPSDTVSIITLENFTNPQHKWTVMNDPVMGGKSTSDFQISDGIGSFVGEVVDVPFLHAPGFIKIEASDKGTWPDISHCQGLQILAQSDTDYGGHRLSFGRERPKHAFPYIYGYKANLTIPREESIIRLPFDAFTDDWDPATGDEIVSCQDDPQYCPNEKTKKSLSSIAIWGEGVAGKVALRIKGIQAYGCGDGEEILLEDFASPRNSWTTMNDPVMGGRSTSSLEIHDGKATFRGTCAIIPFLGAPGFISMVTGRPHDAVFPDVSSCSAFQFVLQTNVDYSGYYLSFGTVRVPGGGHARGYKTALNDLPRNHLGEVVIPFSDFSSKWDEATREVQVRCLDDTQYCPSIESLQDVQIMVFWGEGVEGDVSLDVKSTRAIRCASSAYRSSLPAKTLWASEKLPQRSMMVALSWMVGFIVAGFLAQVVRRRRSFAEGFVELKGSDA